MSGILRVEGLAYTLLYVALCAAVLFVRVLPLTPGLTLLPGPDLILCLTLAWVLRRPEHVPALAIAAVVLVEDLLTDRAPGLWPLMVLAGAAFVRSRRPAMREVGLLVEWAVLAGVMLAATLLYWLILVIVMAPVPPLDLSLTKLAVTVAVYPVVVGVMQGILRVRKPATGELDERGRRL